VGEDPVDIRASREAFAAGPVERLKSFGLLDDRALLAHGIHLTESDYEAVAEAGATIVHNPESNAHNGVGRLRVPEVSDVGCRVGLGTDGMSGSVQRALRFAFLSLRGATQDPTAGYRVLPSLLEENARVARGVFDEPRLGFLEKGAPADLVVLDAPPPTAMKEDNLFGHLIFGSSEAPVRHTVARGRVVLEDFRHTTLNPAEVAREAREVAVRVWERFHALDWDTPYLGR
jgi:cytosine/adenosine deaminase-related metal-dependent hydrolase